MSSLMKDGMDTDEAAEAVQPPSESPETDSDESSNGGEVNPGNPHKLKKCSISLKRIVYIEKAVKKGCKSILFRYCKVPKLIL